MGTHKSQHAPEEVAAEAQYFMSVIQQCVIGPHHDKWFIINMDQMPFYFSMNAIKTLELGGRSMVPIRKLTMDTK